MDTHTINLNGSYGYNLSIISFVMFIDNDIKIKRIQTKMSISLSPNKSNLDLIYWIFSSFSLCWNEFCCM